MATEGSGDAPTGVAAAGDDFSDRLANGIGDAVADDDADVYLDIEDVDEDDDDDDGCDVGGPRSAEESDFSDEWEEEDDDEAAAKQRKRGQLIFLTRELLKRDATYLSRPLSELNGEAAAFQKAGDDMSAIAAYAKFFAKVKAKRLTHRELYVTHCNRAQAYLNLGLFEEALWDASRSIQLAGAAIEKTRTGVEIYVKAHAKKGMALAGLRRWQEASATFDRGLKCDPFHSEMKRGLELSQREILGDLLSGRSQRFKALPSSRKFDEAKITMQPYSAPLFKIRTEDMLPRQLLTPFQAENDYHVKDTYNYMTVQADTRMPKVHLRALQDVYRQARWRRAIEEAVRDIQEDDRDCRVLDLGAGAGLHTMEALHAGAYHVTAVERWLYLAMSSKEVILKNGYNDDQVKVVYKRPTDLVLKKDVPIVCNLLLCDILDDGLLTSGLIPAVRHCLQDLTVERPVVIPMSATVYVQAGEVLADDACGFDVSGMNRHRWMPCFASGLPFNRDSFVPLSQPMEVWHFDMLNPPEEASQHALDIHFSRAGRFNAVRFWYDLHLYGDVHLSTGPESVEAGLKTLRPAVQYLSGILPVEEGDVAPLTCMHNTVRIRFDLDEAEYISLARPDASFPQIQFSYLGDVGRNEAYCAAIERVVARMKRRGEEVHALDMGCGGSALLAMMAARAGADSVVAAELHDGLCDTARHVVAQNGLSSKVTVVNRDIGLLERGKEVRTQGANLVIADFFDAGLLHDNVLFLLEKAKRNVLQSDFAVVPAAATVYCMGIEAYTKSVEGFDFTPINKYRWDSEYEPVDLSRIPHKKLTKPKKVFEYFFQGQRKGRSRENVLKLDVVDSGLMNAVVFWFDLHLDEEETLTSAPFGIGLGGTPTTDATFPDISSLQMSAEENQDQPLAAAAEAEDEDGEEFHYIPAAAFAGEKRGYAFKLGSKGLGYYVDIPWHVAAPSQSQSQGSRSRSNVLAEVEGGKAGPCDDDMTDKHHWGQALQYLERALVVSPTVDASGTNGNFRGKKKKKRMKVTLLAKREGHAIKFSLREGVGQRVGKAPWKVEWGGGASVENPHFQRVHYCQLLVSDFLMRLRSKRFPPIEKDMKMMLANCGNLFLDPAVVSEVYHEFVCLEMIHGQPEFCPGASMQALTKVPLMFS